MVAAAPPVHFIYAFASELWRYASTTLWCITDQIHDLSQLYTGLANAEEEQKGNLQSA